MTPKHADRIDRLAPYMFAELERRIQGRRALECHQRAEDLLGDDPHGGFGVGEHRGADEESAVTLRGAPAAQGGAANAPADKAAAEKK